MRSCVRPLILLAGLCLALWVPTCGLWDYQGHDEPRYVTVSREFLDHPGPVLTLHGVPYREKGPVGFWAIAACIAPASPSTLVMLSRLPSVLAGAATVLLVFALARRLLGERAAWASALVLLASPLILQMVPTARLDMPFTALLTFAAWAWLGRETEGAIPWPRWTLLWGSVATALLIKGPPALLFPVALVGGEAFGARSWKVVRDARPLAGLGLVLGPAAVWLTLQASEAGLAFVLRMLERATVERVAGVSHIQPFWFYLPRILLCFAPWSILLVPAARAHLRRRESLEPRVVALWAWLLLPLLVFSAVSGKRTVYLVPLLVPAAILVGGWFDRAVPRDEPLPRATRALGATLLALAAGLPVVFFSSWVPIPEVRHGEAVVVSLAALLAAGGLLLLLQPRNGDLLLRASAAVVLAGALVDYVFVLPAEAAITSSRAFCATMDSLLPVPEKGRAVLGVVGTARDAEYHVYGRYEVRIVEGKANVFPGPATVPDHLLFVDRQSSSMREGAEEAGFVPVWRGEAAGASLVLLRRLPR